MASMTLTGTTELMDALDEVRRHRPGTVFWVNAAQQVFEALVSVAVGAPAPHAARYGDADRAIGGDAPPVRPRQPRQADDAAGGVLGGARPARHVPERRGAGRGHLWRPAERHCTAQEGCGSRDSREAGRGHERSHGRAVRAGGGVMVAVHTVRRQRHAPVTQECVRGHVPARLAAPGGADGVERAAPAMGLDGVPRRTGRRRRRPEPGRRRRAPGADDRSAGRTSDAAPRGVAVVPRGERQRDSSGVRTGEPAAVESFAGGAGRHERGPRSRRCASSSAAMPSVPSSGTRFPVRAAGARSLAASSANGSRSRSGGFGPSDATTQSGRLSRWAIASPIDLCC